MRIRADEAIQFIDLLNGHFAVTIFLLSGFSARSARSAFKYRLTTSQRLLHNSAIRCYGTTYHTRNAVHVNKFFEN